MRQATEQDLPLLKQWIEQDADHRGKVTPDFFFNEELGIECMVIEREGKPVLFLRTLRALRVDIQFGPSATNEEKDLNRETMQNGFEWLMKMAQGSGFRQVIFDSTSRELRAFSKRRLEFKDSPDELVCRLAAPPKKQAD